jgi:hypothetical protein
MATANPTTLAAASAALAMLLENGASQPVSTNGLKTRRKKIKRTADEATRKAEEEKKIEESVRALKRAKVRKEEIEVRERVSSLVHNNTVAMELTVAIRFLLCARSSPVRSPRRERLPSTWTTATATKSPMEKLSLRDLHCIILRRRSKSTVLNYLWSLVFFWGSFGHD